MLYIIGSCLFYAGGFVWLVKRKWKRSEDKELVLSLYGLLAPYLFALFSLFGVPLTGGLYEGYSKGKCVGYFTKLSRKGICWKTWETEIQVGTGEMAALQSPHPLSTTDEKWVQEIKDNLGKKARVSYIQWLVMPFWKGNSGYEITGIEWEEK